MGDIRISRAISGAGLSGISVTSLTFRTTDGLLNTGIAAAVMVSGIGNLPTFYINKRTYRDGVWTVECLDRCAFLDVVIIPTSNGQPGGQPWAKDEERYSTGALRNGFYSQCGANVNLPYTETYIPCEKVDGKTFQTVLSEMAEAYCGYFGCWSGNTVELVRYDSQRSGDTISDYSMIHDDGEFSYSSVSVSNGKKTVVYGSGAPRLTINNDMVSDDLGDTATSQLYNGIVNRNFYGWSVDNAVSVISAMPIIGGSVNFGSVTYSYDAEMDMEFGVVYPVGQGDNTDVAGLRIIGPAVHGYEFGLHAGYHEDGSEESLIVFPLAGIGYDIPAGSSIDIFFAGAPWLSELAAMFADEDCTDQTFQSYTADGAKIQVIRAHRGTTVTKRVTYADARVVGGALLLSMGGQIPQYGEINRRGLMQQKLDEAVSTTKTYGCLKLNPYGQTVLVPNEEATP